MKWACHSIWCDDACRLRFARFVCVLVAVLLVPKIASSNDGASFDRLRGTFPKQALPLLKQFCLDCHSTEQEEGELNLERFATLDDVRRDPAAWQKVAGMLGNGEMPPEESPQLSSDQKTQLLAWVGRYLDVEARANAGDPGPVVLRRLNNAEYTYTIRDLTGVKLDPARSFPVDGAAGEGFTNTGDALVMSPALVAKYLDAAKEIARHAVLVPDGIRFSPGNTQRDWTDELLNDIRSIYLRHTGKLGDASAFDRWSVADPTQLTNEDGRVDLPRYFAALVGNRDRLLESTDVVGEIAKKENLNAKYLGQLAGMLVSSEPKSLLLEEIRRRWRAASPDEADEIVAEIRGWQDRLWKFNPVGHFGPLNGWQQPVSPLSESQSFRTTIEKPADGDVATLYLIAGAAGDANASDVVAWNNPQIVRAGRPPLPLRDVRAVSVALERTRQNNLARTKEYLSAAFEARTADQPSDVAALAKRHGVDPEMLTQWLSYLGIAPSTGIAIKEYLNHPLEKLGGYDFVNGWTLRGMDALSLLGNASDDKVNIPGDMNPHKIVVHPRPERWVAAGWKSPIGGRVKLEPSVKDAHPQCGNGVSWSFELRQGDTKRVLGTGHLDRGGSAAIEPIEDLVIKKGDLISLVIGPRDRNHACDLTEIELTITEQTDEKRTWSLSGDCADDIGSANPHADGFGNQGVWHFYTGLIEGESDPQQPVIPPGSLLVRWLDADDAATAAGIAEEIKSLVTQPLSTDAAEPEAALHRQLTSLDGPLYTRLDYALLARSVTAEEMADAKFGLDPQLFGRHPDGLAVPPEQLIVRAPSIVEVKLPAEWVAGSALVVSATLGAADQEQSSVQPHISTVRPADAHSLLPGVPIVVRRGSQAETRMQESVDQFRHFFPTAMCYTRIVPVDVVVTLILFHREDEHLSRLMLDENESERLNRLWNELHYVSKDALTSVTAYEQLMEFATQDDDPSKYEPLREPINNSAAALRKKLIDTEPIHLEALIDIANQAYRRPLTSDETDDLRRLYTDLREQELPHEQTIRLLLARVLTAPAFLYRLEMPGPGKKSRPVSDWELANRLSYFLWSSPPDDTLRDVALSGRLHEPEVLAAQARRMLDDPRTRRLAIEFACQWLHIRDFDQHDEKNEQLFPQFAELRGDMYEESVRFFEDLFRHDRSILDVLDSDHTFLNERLAGHYGVAGVTGDQWRRVPDMKQFSRGGILAQATILGTQSGASRTSPILRGNWVAETLLGERLPRPPKDVPLLPDDASTTKELTMRQLVEKHTSDVACAKCHKRIDPYGFALENFDAIGRFRDTEAGDQPIDTRTTLMDGTKIDGLDGLRTYLLTTRRDAVLRQFCRKLLGYALGRSVQLSDEPLLAEMKVNLEEKDYHFGTAVDTIVRSRQFREIRGASADDGGQ